MRPNRCAGMGTLASGVLNVTLGLGLQCKRTPDAQRNGQKGFDFSDRKLKESKSFCHCVMLHEKQPRKQIVMANQMAIFCCAFLVPVRGVDGVEQPAGYLLCCHLSRWLQALQISWLILKDRCGPCGICGKR